MPRLNLISWGDNSITSDIEDCTSASQRAASSATELHLARVTATVRATQQRCWHAAWRIASISPPSVIASWSLGFAARLTRSTRQAGRKTVKTAVNTPPSQIGSARLVRRAERNISFD
ncbi:uncharacterized protein L969DRAFT_43704 [Mixia osmundae IAM 14324]|uniref:Uncharacterized protein n=1 Tax=Mixia osmundae (strain CBS 9802 / IAM 14324 / JCM 22182 / KY 12970) TaxID=764103 RepID=G7DTA8_MIXOS|nr:uncharacterized protein L969DRAFT_43704 [Mixia osmundae IAM 14324]KEI42907.1 hypothetical protein L969DRAFT_43704 [Mixia osmundae IAM 14324]GAA93755.1 hypothetical protein E5Q_00401 [Mixia osmundae IAM 14324]